MEEILKKLSFEIESKHPLTFRFGKERFRVKEVYYRDDNGKIITYYQACKFNRSIFQIFNPWKPLKDIHDIHEIRNKSFEDLLLEIKKTIKVPESKFVTLEKK